eukprot:2239789-Rhodomonas_salina.1
MGDNNSQQTPSVGKCHVIRPDIGRMCQALNLNLDLLHKPDLLDLQCVMCCAKQLLKCEIDACPSVVCNVKVDEKKHRCRKRKLQSSYDMDGSFEYSESPPLRTCNRKLYNSFAAGLSDHFR